MKCPNCNADVSPDEVSCPSCGAKIGEEIIERLLPLLKRPSEEPASPLPVYYKFLAGIVKPHIVFSNTAVSPDPLGPFIVILLNALLSTTYSSIILNKLSFTDIFFSSIFKTMIGPLTIELFYFNLLFAFLELVLVSFLYWLPFKLLGRGSSFKSFVSIISYAYTVVLLGQLLSIIIVSTSTTIIPVSPGTSLPQLLILQLSLYSIWILGKIIKLACLLIVAFLVTPGVRKITRLSTSLSLTSSYAIMVVVVLFLASI